MSKAREAAAKAFHGVLFAEGVIIQTNALDAAIDAFLGALKADGYVILEHAPLVEKLGRAFASQGHSMSPDSTVTYEDDDGHECSSPYWLFHEFDKEAEQVIATLAQEVQP